MSTALVLVSSCSSMVLPCSRFYWYRCYIIIILYLSVILVKHVCFINSILESRNSHSYMHWIGSSLSQHFSPGPFHPSWPLTGLHDLCNLGQLILQSAIGVLVLVLCFVERKEFSMQIVSKLGSSFSLVPFVIVVVWTAFLLSFGYWIVQRLLN